MIYTEFLTLINEHTGNTLNKYKVLCRLCLGNQSNGIDIADDNNCQLNRSQIDAILNNYIVITKVSLPVTNEYPKFLCWPCVDNLSRNARFVQQIEQNAENWETFLESHKYVKVEPKYAGEFDDCPLESQQIAVNGLDEIKIEVCDVMNIDNAPNTDTIEMYDVLELPSFDNLSSIDNTSPLVEGKMKRRPKLSMKPITEFDRTCKLCDERTFSTLGLLYRHQREMHPGMKWYSCDICGAEFSHKLSMCAHMKDRHSNSGKKHQCQFCARLFYSDREMKSHESVHLNARSYVCNLCGKGLNTKSCLNKHLDGKQHNNDYKPKKYDRKKRKQKSSVEKGIYRCEICKPSIVFTSPEDRAHHKNLMHKVHECEICKNSFLTLESLERHKLLHSGKPRPYICSVCNASFSQSSHLSSHFKCKHTDEKRFQCSFCDKMFVENFGLTAHINLVHSKQNRTKCNECEKDFAAPKYLQLHILDKHSTECSPYDCKICGKRNLNALYLERHRRKHHKEGSVK